LLLIKRRLKLEVKIINL